MGRPTPTFLDAELYLPSRDRARFSWGGREYEGEPGLGEERLLDLGELELEPARYGALLFESVFPAGSALARGLQEALLEVERTKRRLRFHLHLSPSLPDGVHALYWELLFDPEHELALARSPDTAFSRYGALSRSPGVPAAARPRLLCVVSAPSDLERFQLAAIDREEILRHFAAAVADLADEIEIAVLEPPATLSRLRDRLVSGGGFHLLHFFGHGSSRNQGGGTALVLEDDDGRARFVDEKLLAEAFLGDRELRLVTLVACHGGAPSSEQVWSGLAGRLVERGIPAVIAMRRAVKVIHAKVFVTHLYRHVARTGQVDAAVNEARHQLYLSEPGGIEWSSPVLYQRLADGRLWLPEGEGEAATAPEGRLAWRRLRHPLPWVPALLALFWTLAAFLPAPRAEVEMDLHASGMSFRLARPQRLLDRLPLEGISVRLPVQMGLPATLPPFSSGTQRSGSVFFGKGGREGSSLAFQAPLLPPGTEVFLEREEEDEMYHLGFSRSPATFQLAMRGEVSFKPGRRPRAVAYFEHPDSVSLTPQEGTLDLRLLCEGFPEKAFEAEIAVDRLQLSHIEEEHSTRGTRVERRSTLRGGEVRMQANGQTYRIEKGEALVLEKPEGVLTGLRLTTDGLRFGWRGRVSELTRTAAGGAPESLKPALLDLAVPSGVQGRMAVFLAALAVGVPALTVLVSRSTRTARRSA